MSIDTTLTHTYRRNPTMKFKMQNKQNQLIERISVKHLIVGVDIAQQLHVARAVNFRGIVIGDPLTFKNNEEGFASLLKWMKNLQRLNNLDEAIVGMEPTGHYWINLSKWLSKQNIEVVTVNPQIRRTMDICVKVRVLRIGYLSYMTIGFLEN